MADIHVFIGPSLPMAEARNVLDAVYHPPAAATDILNLVALEPSAIVLIDGVFEQVPSVRHKEILHALSRGIRIFGASSMGALRAMEMHPYGMEGVGRVFEMYRSGEIEDDDEVVLSHADASLGFRPVSEAMVNLREGLAAAERAGAIGATSRDVLAKAAKRLFYAERSWPAVFRLAESLEVPAAERTALKVFVAEHRPNVKRDDALRVLRLVAEERQRGLLQVDGVIGNAGGFELFHEIRPDLVVAAAVLRRVPWLQLHGKRGSDHGFLLRRHLLPFIAASNKF